MNFEIVKIDVPEGCNIILGQSHFIKTVEDLHEDIAETVPGAKFGIGFCEASGKRLIRKSGNDETLVELASKKALEIGAGHSFIIYLKDAYPINVLNKIKNVSEVCRIFCATANPVEVLIAETNQGRGIIGVIDGYTPKGIETEEDVKERKELLRKFGYKL
ncbi:MAG: adenosine-specific kinase [Candidatus Aenigmarchaeota archaeon]|nr:adenosine-specific kinase [Candidatus Aenigmarchaeota archaeon]